MGGAITPRRPSWRLGDAARRQLLAAAAGRLRDGYGAARRDASAGSRPDADAVIAAAVRQESAAALGRSGRRLQAALAALAAGDGLPTGSPERQALATAAAVALWECVVQREALGLSDHAPLSECYGVPPALWRMIG